jgi:hypothetical protein
MMLGTKEVVSSILSGHEKRALEVLSSWPLMYQKYMHAQMLAHIRVFKTTDIGTFFDTMLMRST